MVMLLDHYPLRSAAICTALIEHGMPARSIKRTVKCTVMPQNIHPSWSAAIHTTLIWHGVPARSQKHQEVCVYIVRDKYTIGLESQVVNLKVSKRKKKSI